MSLEPGTLIGGHARLLRMLGRGGMGSVWLAEHLRLEIPVAVKVLGSPELMKDPKLVERLLREGRAAAKIKNPHVVQIIDVGRMEDGSPYVIMEVLEGESLRDRLEREPVLSPSLASHIVSQTAVALKAAHKLGIVHRDIKPDNIFLCDGVTDEPFVKVLDFGIAFRTGLARDEKRLTSTSQMVGTPAYMSPEQILTAETPGPSTDAWALSATAYEMVAGDIPFDGDTMGAMLMAISHGKYRPPRSLRPELHEVFDAWFARAFELDPEMRHARIEETAATFAEACRIAGGLAPALASSAPKPAFDAETPTAVLRLSKAEPEEEPPTVRRPPPATFGGASTPVRTARERARRGRIILGGAAAVLVIVVVAAIAVRTDTTGETAKALPSDEPSAPAVTTAASSVPARPSAPPGMVLVPAGEYEIGCSVAPGTCYPDEGPPKRVEVAAFAIMQHEVTVAAFAECVSAERCDPPSGGEQCVASNENEPVRCVSWLQSKAYCSFSGGRLPTEVEWEVAARGPDAPRYPWGSEPPSCDRTVMAGCGEKRPRTVGSVGGDRSWVGALDMGGNVREWTATEDGDERITRGGGFELDADKLASTWTRDRDSPQKTRGDLGFRCAADPRDASANLP